MNINQKNIKSYCSFFSLNKLNHYMQSSYVKCIIQFHFQSTVVRLFYSFDNICLLTMFRIIYFLATWSYHIGVKGDVSLSLSHYFRNNITNNEILHGL